MDMLIVCYVKYKMNGDEEGMKGNTDLQNLIYNANNMKLNF